MEELLSIIITGNIMLMIINIFLIKHLMNYTTYLHRIYDHFDWQHKWNRDIQKIIDSNQNSVSVLLDIADDYRIFKERINAELSTDKHTEQ